MLFYFTMLSGLAVAATRFVDKKGRPIDEIIVEGNRQVSRYEILEALDKGPDNIKVAVKVMKLMLPYFQKVKLRIRKEDGRLIAHIKVVEKGRTRYDTKPVIAFNRVDGWRLGLKTGVFVAGDMREPARGKVYGEFSCGMASGIWNYKVGIASQEGWLRQHNLQIGISAYRLTDVRDIDVMPGDAEQFGMAFLSGGDVRDYYQRNGAEIALDWQPFDPTQFLLQFRDERHSSLSKHSDWSLFQRDKVKLDNLHISEGYLKSVRLTTNLCIYHPNDGVRLWGDVEDDRVAIGVAVSDAPVQGWLNSFTIEYASRWFDSDFDFTLGQIHLRKHTPISEDAFINFRVKAGVSNNSLPMQRKFIIGGVGTLRGYNFREFTGDNLILGNLEFGRQLAGGIYSVFFVDIGDVWDYRSALKLASNARASAGVGILLGSIRFNVAQALEENRKPVFSFRFSRMF